MSRQSKSTGTNAYDLLLSAIEEGQLPSGTRLREVELASRFAISRTPVREALKRLEAQGLVAHEPHHGAVVATLDYASVIELYHIREVLEGTAAGLCATHATEPEIDLLQSMVAADRAIAQDAPALARSNRQFHRQIHLSARNRFLNVMLENMRLSLALLPGTTLGMPTRGPVSVEEHAVVVARIAARDAAGAEKAARDHIRNAFRTRIAQILPHQE